MNALRIMNATEARRHFGELLDSLSGNDVVVERYAQPQMVVL